MKERAFQAESPALDRRHSACQEDQRAAWEERVTQGKTHGTSLCRAELLNQVQLCQNLMWGVCGGDEGAAVGASMRPSSAELWDLMPRCPQHHPLGVEFMNVKIM